MCASPCVHRSMVCDVCVHRCRWKRRSMCGLYAWVRNSPPSNTLVHTRTLLVHTCAHARSILLHITPQHTRPRTLVDESQGGRALPSRSMHLMYLVVCTYTLCWQFNVTAPVPQNQKVMDLYLRAQQETTQAMHNLRKWRHHQRTASAFATLDMRVCADVVCECASSQHHTPGVIKTSLMCSLPAVEDGNNFGVAVVRDVIDMAEASIAANKKEIDTFPTYFKERAAAVKAVSTRSTSSSSESTSKGADDSSKNGEQEKTTKDSTSSSSETKTETPTPLEDELAHIVALDVNWYLKFVAQLMAVHGHCATVCDYMEKNESKISNPKGSGAGLSMF